MTYRAWYILEGVEFRIEVLDVKWPWQSDSERQESERNECNAQLSDM
jgi:hypothetical protein